MGGQQLILGIGLVATLAACILCPPGELKTTEGTLPVQPGAEIQFVMQYGDEVYEGVAGCDLHWYVDEVEGGNDEVGRISSCGRYTAPLQTSLSAVTIDGVEYILGTCSDCCPGARREIELAR